MNTPMLPTVLEAMALQAEMQLSVMERTVLRDALDRNDGDTTEAVAMLDSWIGEASHDEDPR